MFIYNQQLSQLFYNQQQTNSFTAATNKKKYFEITNGKCRNIKIATNVCYAYVEKMRPLLLSNFGINRVFDVRNGKKVIFFDLVHFNVSHS